MSIEKVHAEMSALTQKFDKATEGLATKSEVKDFAKQFDEKIQTLSAVYAQRKDAGLKMTQNFSSDTNADAFICKALEKNPTRDQYISKADFASSTSGSGAEFDQTGYSNDLLMLTAQASVALANHNVLPITDKEMQFSTSTNAGYAKFKTSEGGSITGVTETTGYKTVVLKEIQNLWPVSRKLIRESRIGIADYISGLFRDQAARTIDRATFVGTGASSADYGGITGYGYVSAATSNEVLLADYDNLVNNTNSGSNGINALLSVVNKLQAAWPGVMNTNLRWVFHPTVLWDLMRIKDTNNRPIWEHNGKLDATTGSLLGIPVATCCEMPSSATLDSAASTNMAVAGLLVDMRTAGKICVGRNMEVEVSEHYLFGNDQTAFRMCADFGFTVVQPKAVCRLTIGNTTAA